MIKQKFNNKWKYWIDKDSFSLVWDIPEYAKEVDLPHDAMIETKANPNSLNGSNTGFRDGDIYTYVKTLYAPEEYKNKTIMLKFEGVYMNAFVYINEQLAAKNPFGYTTFYVPLNDFLNYGQQNEIRVQVRAGAMTNSRWYSGAGIYRDVYLLESDLTYIVPEGVQIKTEALDTEYATISINTELKSRKHTLAEFVLKTTIKDTNGNIVANDESTVSLFEREERKLIQRVVIENPNLWSAETPYLYTCTSKLYENGNLIDENREIFGIRTLDVDSKRGLRINGQAVNLRGACIHHDSGLLGTATYEDAQLRQIQKLKEAGFNAIRMSHQPIAPAMLRACDVLGMYVMDETFDMWNRCKSNYDYGLYFQEWWQTDVTAMVRKDYNHPSVILYSIGNEIPEIGTNYGAKICYDLCTKIKSLDNTRFTLASINGVFAAGDKVDKIVADVVNDLSNEGQIDGNVNDFMTLMDSHLDEIVVHDIITERLQKACAFLDIAGYNYMTARYELDSKLYPNRVIVGSETYPPEIARNWELVKKCNHVIGDFTWTGWDYIGEAGIGITSYKFGEGGFGSQFPAQLAYSGDIDIIGFRRPASYFREIVFGLRKEPYIAVQNPYKYGQPSTKTPWVISDSVSSWTWSGCEKKPIIVEVYSSGTEVELFLNGKSIGKKESGKSVGFRTLFETIYEVGVLTAVTYENGKEISRTELKSAKGECQIVLKQEQASYFKELIYIQLQICDKDGTLITDSDKKITLSVEGGVDVIGFGSGNPKPNYNFNENVTETFNGCALIILKKNRKSNQAKINVSTDNINSSLIIEV